jgi:hypothetical protein
VNAQNAGNTQIRATYTVDNQTRTGSRDLQVTAPPPEVRADFTVTPDSDTGAPAGQCVASENTGAGGGNILRCTFDGDPSTPSSGLSYEWEIPVGNDMVSGRSIQGTLAPCQSFGAAGGGAADRNVRLKVTLGGVSDEETKRVTFVKIGAC